MNINVMHGDAVMVMSKFSIPVYSFAVTGKCLCIFMQHHGIVPLN